MLGVAIDTCAATASFAIADSEGRVLWEKTYPQGIRVADVLLPDLQDLLLEAAIQFDGGLGRIVVTIGPGSFTGQRLGLAVAQGLAASSRGSELYGLTSLHAALLTHGVPSGSRSDCIVVADARRGQIYQQPFSSDLKPRGACTIAPSEELADQSISSTTRILALDPVSVEIARAAYPANELVLDNVGEGTAARLVVIGDLASVGVGKVERLRPLYLKPPDAAPAKSAGLRST